MDSPDADRVLELEDGTRLPGRSFGAATAVSGEVVFQTGLVGYPESLTDPSYHGQILVLTYPLIGNYGVPARDRAERFESDRIQARALVVTRAVRRCATGRGGRTLHDWLAGEGVPGVEGIDTRRLTLHLRAHGTLLGRIVTPRTTTPPPLEDPNDHPVLARVSIPEPRLLGPAGRRVILVDCGAKGSITRELLARGLQVLQVPHDFDYTAERFDGIVLSNGPGNPEHCGPTVEILHRALALGRPLFGICLGTQLLARAAGASTYKLPFGHRGQNQPCREEGTERCALTSQNHGFAVEEASLPSDWKVWFRNANDGSIEGIRHARRPFAAVQFHPEACPGPLDARLLFDRFAESLR